MLDLRMTERLGGETPKMVTFGTDDKANYVSLFYYGLDSGRDSYAMLYIGVAERRRGTGRRLLELAIADAEVRNVDKIRGEIVTREGLEFFKDVLGEDFIQIDKVGQFDADPLNPTHTLTRAYLSYPIGTPQKPLAAEH